MMVDGITTTQEQKGKTIKGNWLAIVTQNITESEIKDISNTKGSFFSL